MSPMLRVLMGVVLMAGLNSGVYADDKSAVATDAGLARLHNDITALVGAAKCANLVNCRIAALGTDACGGPADYVAYSWLSTEKAALETKIAEYNFALEDVQKHEMPVNACTTSKEPVAACVNGRCVIPGGR